MNKSIIKLSGIVFFLFILILFAFQKATEEEKSALADNEETLSLVCDIPIPTIQPLEDSIRLLDDVFQEYQKLKCRVELLH